MAKYGFTQYGVSKYGEIDSNRLYYNAQIFAWSYDYGKISVTWKTINPDPADLPATPTHWRLVRTFTGTPDSPYVGTVVSENTISNYTTTYIDEDEAIQVNREVTYSIWVYNGINWIFCGSSTTNSVQQTEMPTHFKRWLPAAWLNDESGIGDAVGEDEDSPLTKTIEAYSFAYDKIKTQAILLQDINDSTKIPTSLLQNKISDLGFQYEASLGDSYHRSLYKAGHFINSLKGTKDGIYTYAISLTHWPTTIAEGHNLILTYNDASFEESIGNWGTASGTIAYQPFATSLTVTGLAIDAPTPKLYDPEFPPRDNAFAYLTANGTNSIDLSLPDLNKDIVAYGIPVTAGKKYIFKGFVRHYTHAGEVFIGFKWYDLTGTLISTTTATSVLAATTTAWQQVKSASENLTDGITAPEGAKYVRINLLIHPSSSGNKHYAIDMLEFREAAGTEVTLSGIAPSLLYEDARLVKIQVESDLENYILNPSFDRGTHWWTPYNAEIESDFHAPAGAHGYASEAVAKLTSLTDGLTALVSDWQMLPPATPHTFSMYVSGAVGRTAIARIEFSQPLTAEDQTKIFSDGGGRYYDPTPYYVDSEPITLTGTAQRVYVSATAPVETTDYGAPMSKVSIYIPDAVAGDVFYLDAAMMTETPDLRDFFEGDGGSPVTDPLAQVDYRLTDVFWDKRPHLNFLSNTTFNNTTGWTADSGTTLTSSSDITPLYGTLCGKVSATGGGSISTVVTYPSGVVNGGEDVTVSAYVKNVAGVYSISTNGQTANNFRISTANKDEWIRIHTNRIATIGETSFTVTISLSQAGSGTKVFYIDGVQAEFGRLATPYLDPTVAGVTVEANPADPTKNISYGYSSMESAGYSFYAYNYELKDQRLIETLPLVMPLGSTWSVGEHPSDVDFAELTSSFVTAPSFERNLEGWTALNSTLTRQISRGTLFDEILPQGGAFAHITSTSTANFGVESDFIEVSPSQGYYASVTVHPENEDAYGDYTLSIDWYTNAYTYIRSKTSTVNLTRNDRWAYLDIVAPASKKVTLTDITVASNVVTVTTAANHGFSVGESLIISISDTAFSSLNGTTQLITAVTSNTITFTATFANTATTELVSGTATFANVGVSYAKIKVICDPVNNGAGRTFHLDKVVFRK